MPMITVTCHRCGKLVELVHNYLADHERPSSDDMCLGSGEDINAEFTMTKMAGVIETEQDRAALEECKQLAELAKGNSGQCIDGEYVFWYPYDHALIPGHIYSEAGRTEFQKITHMCEYHFDEITLPD